jgi:hypothetical protein
MTMIMTPLDSSSSQGAGEGLSGKFVCERSSRRSSHSLLRLVGGTCSAFTEPAPDGAMTSQTLSPPREYLNLTAKEAIHLCLYVLL